MNACDKSLLKCDVLVEKNPVIKSVSSFVMSEDAESSKTSSSIVSAVNMIAMLFQDIKS